MALSPFSSPLHLLVHLSPHSLKQLEQSLYFFREPSKVEPEYEDIEDIAFLALKLNALCSEKGRKC